MKPALSTACWLVVILAPAWLVRAEPADVAVEQNAADLASATGADTAPAPPSRASSAQTSQQLAAPSSVQPAAEDPSPPPLEFHGFVSPGFLVSTGNNFLPQSTHGSAEISEVGINFTRPITDRLRGGVQLFARDFGRIGTYSAKFDWFYLDYRIADWLGLRGGRVKVPFGLYNEANDVDAGRVSILLPQSVYPVQNRDFLLAQTGGEAYGYVTLGSAGALEYRIYGGTIYLDPTPSPGAPYKLRSLDTRYVLGGRLMWETPLEGLRAGASIQALKLESELSFDSTLTAPLISAGKLPAAFDGVVNVELPATLVVGSLEYATRGLTFAAEYSRWYVRTRSDQQALFPETSSTSERGYVLASYALTGFLTPGVYYSLLFPQVDKRKGTANSQHDCAATLRFDVNEHWLVKVEGHYMRGAASLTSELNGGRPLSALDRNWSLFLLKSTLYF